MNTKNVKFIKPTETELEILAILWKNGSSVVSFVHEELKKQKTKEVVYTTTLKLMQIMLDKGLVSRNTSSRAHIYTAAMNQKIAQAHYVHKMVDTVFSGSAGSLVLQTIGNESISEEEINQIKKIIAEREGN